MTSIFIWIQCIVWYMNEFIVWSVNEWFSDQSIVQWQCIRLVRLPCILFIVFSDRCIGSVNNVLLHWSMYPFSGQCIDLSIRWCSAYWFSGWCIFLAVNTPSQWSRYWSVYQSVIHAFIQWPMYWFNDQCIDYIKFVTSQWPKSVNTSLFFHKNLK